MSSLPRSRPNTRPKNANQHPGQIILEGQRTRRTNAQVTAERKKAAEAHAIKLASKNATAQHIAQVQATQRREREASSSEAAKPLTQEQVSLLVAATRGNKKTASKSSTRPRPVGPITEAEKGPGISATTHTESAPARKRTSQKVTKLTRADVDSAAAMSTTTSAKHPNDIREFVKASVAVLESEAGPPGLKRKVESHAAVSESSEPSTKKKFKPAYPSGLLPTFVGYVPPAPPPNVSTSNQNIAEPIPDDDPINYGGYVSSDEEEFQDYSAVYGAEKLKADPSLTENMVYLEDHVTHPETSKSPFKQKRKSRSQGSLGFNTTQLAVWRSAIVPGSYEELSKVANLWDNATTDFGDIFREVHKRLLPDYPLQYRPKSDEYNLIMQKVYGLRNHVSQSAMPLATKWLRDRGITTEDAIVREATRQAGKSATFFALTNKQCKRTGRMVRFGLFQTDIVVRVLAEYMARCSKSIDSMNWYPCGALALAVVAIEHAFKLLSQDNSNVQRPNAPALQFSSANYSSKTQSLASSIGSLSDEEWETILQDVKDVVAEIHATPMKPIQSDTTDDEDDFRANLYTNPNDVDLDDLTDID